MTVDKRIDIVYGLDAVDSNPNGDPDAGNSPRIDSQTETGIITDVCIKRKVKTAAQDLGQDLYIIAGEALQSRRQDVLDRLEGKGKALSQNEARNVMCSTFWDVRTFGAVMSTKKANCGQVRGPVQFTDLRSTHPIAILDQTVSRVAQETNDKNVDTGTFGDRHRVRYGLYVGQASVSPRFAKQSGFGDDDLKILFKAIRNMLINDTSAARPDMEMRFAYAFIHPNDVGMMPRSKLVSRITFPLRDGVQAPVKRGDILVETDFSGLSEAKIDVVDLLKAA